MPKGVPIDPAAIETVRTSVKRVLALRGHAPPKTPFRTAADLPAYWREAESIHGGPDLTLRIATELPVGGFGRTSYAFASAETWEEALEVFCRESLRGMGSGYRAELSITEANAELTLRNDEPLWPIVEMLLAIVQRRYRDRPGTGAKARVMTSR